jgi:hypothetical protein
MSDAFAITSKSRLPLQSRRRGRRIGRTLLVAGAVLSFGLPARADVCRPVLSIQQPRYSAIEDLQRVWRAVVAVDASRCTGETGPFEIRFVRAKENALDLPFTERFSWRPGRVEVALAFWADEAVEHFEIGRVGACRCRD